MEPLHWPDFYQSEADEPQSFWKRLPFIGWLFSSSDYEAVINSVKEQLLARPKPSPGMWGDDLSRVKMARYLCSTVKEEYEWPNDHFIPDDPFEIVFQMPWDDLKIVEFVMRVEEDLDVNVPDEEAEMWGGTLGNIVDYLVAKQKQTTQN